MIAVIWEVTSKLSSLPDFMFPSLTQVIHTLFNGLVSGQIADSDRYKSWPDSTWIYDC